MQAPNMNSSKFCKGQGGYTLLEVLTSVAIVGVMAMVYSSFSNATGLSVQHSVKVSMAMNVAANVAEDLSMIPLTSQWLSTQAELPLGTIYPFERMFKVDGNETANAALSYYRVSWTVARDEPIVGARAVRLNIQWREGSQQRHLGMRVVR